MTLSEFSNEFDILFNNIMRNQAPGLDDYEKSVFLTRAQDEVIKSYFSPTLNKQMQGFDGAERRQIDFSTLVKVDKPNVQSGTSVVDYRKNGVATAYLPDDIMMIVNEFVVVLRNGVNTVLQVAPVSYRDYTVNMLKPFKRPPKWVSWKIQAMDSGRSVIDLIAGNKDTVISYEVRYVKQPKPIILSPLDGITIGGYEGCDSSGNLVTSGAVSGSECELDSIVHPEIVQRAVEHAKASYGGDLQTQLILGQTSATPVGAVSQNSGGR